MKKKYLIFLIMAFFILINKCNARSVEIVLGDQIPDVKLHLKTPTVEKNKNMYKIVRVEDKELVYCVEPGIMLYDGYFNEYNSFHQNPLNMSNEDWIRVSEIAYFGYGYKDRLDIKWYVITQFMIWEYLLRDNGEIYFLNNNDEKIIMYEEEMASINKDILEYRKTPSFTKQNIDGVDYTIRVNEDLVLEDSNSVIEKFVVEPNNSNQLTWKIENNKLHLKFTNTGHKYVLYSQPGILNEPPKIYYNGSSQSVMSRGQIALPTAVTEVNVLNPSLTIKKESTMASSFSLKGTVYGLYNNEDVLLEELVANEEGIMYKDTINVGSYYIKELVATPGYHLNEEIISFDVTNSNIEIVVKNEPIKKTIVLEKYLEFSNGKLELESDAIFEIYNKETNELVKTVTTDKYGKIEFELFYGEYLIKQIKTKTGFMLSDDLILSIVDSNLETLRLINKEIVQDLIIIKKDQATGEPIYQETKFKIKNKDTSEYLKINHNTVFITKDGVLNLKNISYGTYILEEIEAPDGYKIGENVEFQINDKPVELVITNELIKGSILIYKLDKESLKPLANVVFGLYDKDKNLIKEEKTNSEGLIEITNLEVGTYYIKELLTNEEYLLNEEEIKVEVKENVKSVLTITNRLKVEIPKTGVKKSITSFLISSLFLGIGTFICNYGKKDN